MVDITPLVVGLVLGLVGVGVTVWMLVRIWKGRSRASAVPWVAALAVGLVMAVGASYSVVGLVKAFGAVGGESVDPSQQARILAEGMSEAINCTAFGVLLWVPSMVVAFVLTRRKEPRPE